jgi:hypothetical protein
MSLILFPLLFKFLPFNILLIYPNHQLKTYLKQFLSSINFLNYNFNNFNLLIWAILFLHLNFIK